MRGELIVLKREELFNRVWSEPVSTLAVEYGISGVALAKICKRMGLPVPSRGYWARKAAGRRVPRPAFPPLRKDEITEHRFHRGEPPASDSEAVTRQQAHEAEPENRVVVLDSLQALHPLVKRSSGPLRAASKDFTRATHRYRCLDVLVSAEQLDRALRIMDALIRALAGRGNKVEIDTPRTSPPSTSPSRSVTRVWVDDEWVHIALEERRTQVRVPPPPGKEADRWYRERTELRPTGKLRLLIANSPYGESVRTSWADSATQKVESKLNDFIVGLHRAAEAIKQARAKHEQWEAARAEEQRRHEQAAKRLAVERRLASDLETRCEEWAAGQALSRFVDAVETAQRGETSEEVAMWLAWARSHAAASVAKAFVGLLDLRPERREQGLGYWGSPSISPDDVLLYLRNRFIGSTR